jgi:phage host-nuclease inhibitor protein Gam
MAKGELRIVKGQKAQTIQIENKDQADATLAALAELEDWVGGREILAREEIRETEAQMVADTASARAEIAERAGMLEAWAKANKAEIFPEGRKSLELTRGIIGFRIPKSKIKLMLAIENVIAKLKARKLFDCIRLTEEPDLLQLANYDDEQLEAVGLKRTKPKDKFFYELKKTEVK